MSFWGEVGQVELESECVRDIKPERNDAVNKGVQQELKS